METLTRDISHDSGITTLSDNWRDLLPAIATSAGPNCSSRYRFIDTSIPVQIAESFGFQSIQAMAIKSKDPLKRAYGKHSIVMVNRDYSIPGEGYLSLWLRNAHDKTSEFQFMLGFFRTICSNSLIAGTQFDSWRLTHRGFSEFDCAGIVRKAIDNAPYLQHRIEEMKSKKLEFYEADEFRGKAIELIKEKDSESVYSIDSLAMPQRAQDAGLDLWKVMNVTQEKLIRGGAYYRTKQGHFRRTKGCKALDKTAKVNRLLWDLAETYIN